jgi:phage terminase large subunit
MAEEHLRFPGHRSVCIREVQKSLKQSAKRLIEDTLQAYNLGEAQGFKVFREVIETPGDGLIIFQGMQDHTADSVKSLEGFDRAWVEEAQSLSDRSLSLLRPTIRSDGSELWFSWNPTRPTDPIDQLLRGTNLPSGSAVVRANWSDNPWFPAVLEQERRDCLANQPERYGHIWEGEYATVLEGAYYAKHLTDAQIEGRIGFVARDPLNKIYAFWDIGGTSAKSDATSIWIVQFIGAEVRVLDYYEAVGQPFEAHVNWLRAGGYTDAVCVLPHDGRKHDQVYAVTPQSYLQEVGFTVDLVRNQGAGAALQRIDASRRLFPSMRFNEEKTKGGRDALGWYHEKRDEARGIGLGPEHDFASHACLVAGTLIDTSRGLVAIESIKPGDMVKTPAGLAHVQWAGQTKTANEIVRATLDSGIVIEMTPEHKVFTTNGVVRADALGYDDAVIIGKDAPCLRLDRANNVGYRAAFIESFGVSGIGGGRSEASTLVKRVAGSECFTVKRLGEMGANRLHLSTEIGRISAPKIGLRLYPSSATAYSSMSASSSMAFHIIACLTEDTLRAVRRAWFSCTGWFTRHATGQSLTAGTSTTSTATRVTTGQKTLSPCLRSITLACTLKQAVGLAVRRTKGNCAKPQRKPRTGMAAMRASLGIARMASAVGLAARNFLAPARSADANIKRHIQRDPNIVAGVAKVERISVNLPVYDLTVDHHHCYYANGVLVSNSDAFGMIAVYKAVNIAAADDWGSPVRRNLAGIA